MREHDRWLPVSQDPAFDRYINSGWSNWTCPFCGDAMPNGWPDPSSWACCGEVGHAEYQEK